ncbi:ABC transporter permease [Rhodobacteraceae bacterium CCMM004]|nr:ABC transporter permease [Rhodobacteraceae bacterium CCMM004]
MRRLILAAALILPTVLPAWADTVRPKPRPVADPIPVTRWDFRPEATRWSRAAMGALRDHGAPLVAHVPQDVATWCPGYPHAAPPARRAFWVGFLSALAKYESTWKPKAVGGGGRWFGLLQIVPGTARGYGCQARSGQALLSGAANLSCAVRIMAVTVPRDGVIHGRWPRWSGVSADWGPMRNARKRQEMANWLRGQDYCQRTTSPRPRARPAPEGLVWGPPRAPVKPPLRPRRVAALTPAP